MNERSVFVGTDIGTLGTKSVVVDSEGQILGAGFSEYNVLTPNPLWAEQWPDVWYEAACATIREAVERAKIAPKEIAALTVSGLYGGSGIPCDGTMKPLRPCIIWMDRRATDEVAWVKENVGERAVFEVSANYIDSYHGFTKILWIKGHEPDIWKRTYRLMSPYGYVIYQLTGSESMDYCSAGNVAGIFDMHKRDWSREMLHDMGIPRSVFPDELSESSKVVGKIHGAGSVATGLQEGTPVCAGGVDAAVASLSAGALEEGDHVAMIGTSMAYGVIHRGSQYSANMINMPHVVDPKRLVYSFAGSATAGAIVRWFRDQFGTMEKVLGSTVHVDPYDVLGLEARDIPPGSEKLLILPYFMGERAPIWDVSARGTIFGLTLFHTRAHLFRACMEAVAYSLRNCVDFAEGLGMKLRRELALVGGVTKSALWKGIFADVTNHPILCVTGGGEAAYGDAFLGAYGVGLVSDYKQIRDWISFETPVEPHARNAQVYELFYQEYKHLYEALKDNMSALSRIP